MPDVTLHLSEEAHAMMQDAMVRSGCKTEQELVANAVAIYRSILSTQFSGGHLTHYRLDRPPEEVPLLTVLVERVREKGLE